MWGLGSLSLRRQVSSGGQTPGRPLRPRRGGLTRAEGAVSGRARLRLTGLERERRAQTGGLLGRRGPRPGAPNPLLPRPGPQLTASC